MDDPIQERFDYLVSEETDALHHLLRAVAPGPSELAIKIGLVEKCEAYEDRAYPELHKQLVYDARRFARHGAHLQTDTAILAAFSSLRADMCRSLAGEPLSQADEDTWYEWLDAQEEPLTASRATTIEGVLTKLRVAFAHLAYQPWATRSMVEPAHPDFVSGLKDATVYQRMLWSGIEDLARIGGVNLSEQGA